MMIPSIHLNGTSQKELLEQVRNAVVSISASYEILCLATPHGRDYYPQGQEAYTKANFDHIERIGKIKAVHDELVKLYFAIEDGGFKR